MRKKLTILVAILAFTILLIPCAFAHTPLCSCSDEGDGTILCEGGYSDGSSAAGVEMRVLDSTGKVLIKGKMNEDSELTFTKPEGDYTVIFDAGPGHEVKVPSSEITE
jgi:type 1 fimbria pilin